MYCLVCGAKNENGSNFCEKCGSKMEAPKPNVQIHQPVQTTPVPDFTPTPAPMPQKKKKSALVPVLLTIIALLLVGGIGMALFAFGVFEKNPSIDPYEEAYAACEAMAEQGDLQGALDLAKSYAMTNDDPRYDTMVDDFEQRLKDNVIESAAAFAKEGNYCAAIRVAEEAYKSYGEKQYYELAADYRLQFGQYNNSQVSAGKYNTMYINTSGVARICGDSSKGELVAGRWTNLKAVSAGDRHVLALQKDGTVLAAGYNDLGQCSVGRWRDVVAISAGDCHSVALTAEGAVLAAGYNHAGQSNVSQLMQQAGSKRIVSVSAGYTHTLALLEDGTVVACGNNRYGECNVSSWTDIAAIYTGSSISAGLKTDGTVVVTGQDINRINVREWSNIVSMSCGDYYLVGIRADGTAVSANTGNGSHPYYGQTNVEGWTNMKFVSCGNDHTVGLTRDNRMVIVGSNLEGQCDFDGLYLN